MLRVHFALCSFCLITVLMCSAEQSFVVQKKKQISSSALQEQCCECLTSAVQSSAYTVQATGKLQGKSINVMADMLNNSFFTNVSKVDLARKADDWQKFAQRQEEINELLKKQIAFLDKENSYVQSPVVAVVGIKNSAIAK